MTEILNLILGTNDVASFAASIFFALVGILLGLLMHSTTRNVNSPRTPIPFFWEFLVLDNLKRILIGIILVFVGIRFSEELLGARHTLFTSLVVGLSIDKLAKIIQNRFLNP